MSEIPEKLLYSHDHEWVAIADGIATIGISHHAQDQLGDVVYLGDFPDIGANLEKGDAVGVIESVKATSDIFAPLSGKLVEVNSDLLEAPELVNSDPYDDGWMLVIKMSNPKDYDNLLTAEAYRKHVEKE